VTRFTVVSILPEIVDGALAVGVVGRARAAGGLPLGVPSTRATSPTIATAPSTTRPTAAAPAW
jgi:tRNA G37 N-methylase TrmD